MNNHIRIPILVAAAVALGALPFAIGQTETRTTSPGTIVTAPPAQTTVVVPATTTAPAAVPAQNPAPARYAAPVAAAPIQGPTVIIVPAPTTTVVQSPGAQIRTGGESTSTQTMTEGERAPTTTQDLIDDARMIRNELVKDSSVAYEPVEIMPQNGRILLRGTVSSPAAKERIEATANWIAPRSRIVSEIKSR